MAYNIIKTDGTPLATVSDGQTNSTATSLTLVGKNFAGYGTFLNENLVALLENFSNNTQPSNPITGQLWYQKTNNLLQVYNGNAWKSISGAQNQADEPTYKVAGDMWFDSVNQQLKVYSGSGWIVIGPSFTSTTGTSGAVADTIIDTSQFSHVVVKFFVQNQLIGILSKDATFTPATTIAGFPSVKPGLNLAQGFTPDLNFYQTANNASYLGNLPAASYLTKDNALLTSGLTIQNTQGVTITENDGTVSDFQLYMASNYVNLESLVRGNGFVIKLKPDAAGGSTLAALTIDRTTGLITVLGDPTSPSGIATQNYVDSKDNIIKNWLSTNVSLIYSNISTLIGNTTSVYGNTRLLQQDLGYNVQTAIPTSSGINPGGTHSSAYQLFSANSSTSFAGNLLTLWANVAAHHANVLTNSGDNTLNNPASMYSNVRTLQSSLSSLQVAALRRDGTLSITGNLAPDGVPGGLDPTKVHDLGSADYRFNRFYTQEANVVTITNTQSINLTGNRGIGEPFTIATTELRTFGNIKLTNSDGTANVNLGFPHSINVEGGISTRGAITTKANLTHNIGSATNWFGTIYAQSIVASSIVGAISSGGASSSFGATQFGGSITPNLDLTYNVGDYATSKRWLDVGASTFTSSYISLTSTGIAVGSGLADATADLGLPSPGKRFRHLYAQDLIGTTITVSTGISLTAGSADNNKYDVGASGAAFRAMYATNFYGQATTATYGDLAERFAADAIYAPGTVVRLGGEAEITIENAIASDEVFGVIATNPAYKMNAEAGSDETHPYVAMTGRVPVRVTGPVRKGQRLVSAGNGTARGAFPGEALSFNVLGRSLVNKTTEGEELIEAIVKVN